MDEYVILSKDAYEKVLNIMYELSLKDSLAMFSTITSSVRLNQEKGLIVVDSNKSNEKVKMNDKDKSPEK